MNKIAVVLIMFGVVVVGLSSMANADDAATVWYDSPDQPQILYNISINGTTGHSTAYEDNWISLSVTVKDVVVSGKYEQVDIVISAVVYSKTEAVVNTGSVFKYEPARIKFSASENNAPYDNHIDFDRSFDGGVNITGTNQNNKVDDEMEDTAVFAMEQIIGYLNTYAGIVISGVDYIATHLQPKFPEDMEGGADHAWVTFPLDSTKIVWDENADGHGYVIYAASTRLYWRIPTNSLKTYQLKISAENIMSQHIITAVGDEVSYKDGATSTVTITIKNGQITSLNAYTENVNDSAGNTFYTKDYTPSSVTDPNKYYVVPTLIVNADNPGGAPVNYKVDWGDKNYTYLYSQPSGEQYSLTHKYYPRKPVGEGRDYTINVTAYVDDYYGGWSENKTINITVINNGKMSSSGSGGCPFLYTYSTNGWKSENNILVWAENATRPSLDTEDYYLFNGTENNGNITIGIGEPGNDVDFIDSVKLYRVNSSYGYNVAESYSGKVYAYKNVKSGIAMDNHGRNVTSLINKEDGNYWLGDKGDYVNIFLNLSRKNLLVIRGIDNPPEQNSTYNVLYRPPATTMSTIWVYANLSNEWVKLGEIKVRHNLHENVVNLNNFTRGHSGNVELRFVMRDRNGIDFIGLSHDFRIATLKNVKLEDSSYGYEKIKSKDGNYLRLNPGDFVRMNFNGRGNGLYLLKVNGFYFNREKIGKGIGIVKENEINIAEAKLQTNITSGVNYVLLPLLENYSDIYSIMWFVDGQYSHGEKPIVNFGSGDHVIELYVRRTGGEYQEYTLEIKAS